MIYKCIHFWYKYAIFIYLLITKSIHLQSIYPSIPQSTKIHPSIHLSIYLSINPSFLPPFSSLKMCSFFVLSLYTTSFIPLFAPFTPSCLQLIAYYHDLFISYLRYTILQLFTGNYKFHNLIVMNLLPVPVTTQYLRIYPVIVGYQSVDKCLRAEVYGYHPGMCSLTVIFSRSLCLDLMFGITG